jgi:hypothetical protein
VLKQRNLSKPNGIPINFCVWNRQVFGLYRLHCIYILVHSVMTNRPISLYFNDLYFNDLYIYIYPFCSFFLLISFICTSMRISFDFLIYTLFILRVYIYIYVYFKIKVVNENTVVVVIE